LLKAGDVAEALALYVRAARLYAVEGSTLKAVAVFRQVREMVRKHALTDNALDDEARAALPGLYRALGLDAEADEVEREPTRSPRSMQ
jgi:hypothetical protein